MNQNELYNLCCKYHRKRVRIVDREGRLHLSEVTSVSRNMVFGDAGPSSCGVLLI